MARNLDFARANVKTLIYDQAVLEGVATTFPQTETILENGKVSGVTPTDVQKIINLKHAWDVSWTRTSLPLKAITLFSVPLPGWSMKDSTNMGEASEAFLSPLGEPHTFPHADGAVCEGSSRYGRCIRSISLRYRH
ncbi:MAG: hypothetical protein LKE39_05555 [Sphaerochaeta sp.]|nr:hypothetical protein [Sphaerochaeta sp.]